MGCLAQIDFAAAREGVVPLLPRLLALLPGHCSPAGADEKADEIYREERHRAERQKQWALRTSKKRMYFHRPEVLATAGIDDLELEEDYFFRFWPKISEIGEKRFFFF